MKPLKGIALLLAIMAFMAFQGFSQKGSPNAAKKNLPNSQITADTVPGKFIDTNNDGVCDNYQPRMKNIHGANFVDKNWDGICDNRGTSGNLKGNGDGCRQGCHHRHRHGNPTGNCCELCPGCGKGNRYKK